MTLLEINLTDVLSETDPDDRVVVWAPVLREGPSGALIGTRGKAIPLTDGVGSDEVVPGPLMVQVQCKAMSDTRPREVVVPDEGPVTLTGLFDSAGAFTYSPAVVGQVAQYRAEAVQAAADADLAADRAEAGATTAAGHATQTADDRRQTGEDRTQTGLDRQAAAQSATNAATSATTAEGHKTTVQTALAGAQLYSGTGFPNGVVTAPVGSIYTDTAATAGAIRWIKTSGTGNTGWKVEYGDTGFRNVAGLLENGWTSGPLLLLRRTGDIVRLGASYNTSLKGDQATGNRFITLPQGFKITPSGNYGLVGTAMHLPWAASETMDGEAPVMRDVTNGLAVSKSLITVSFNLSWPTSDPWPANLPGVPA